eukprot:GEMP01017014.1.p1 GENE.GEMP01017014.1~~GEMP01017014.1.p1  ORF type:complete len:570 (+),score=150.56 GEMP01017014.1:169-1878(+)
MDACIFAWLQSFDVGVDWTSRVKDYTDGENIARILEYMDADRFPIPEGNVVETTILKVEEFFHETGRPLAHRVNAQDFRSGEGIEIMQLLKMVLVVMVTLEENELLTREHLLSLSEEHQQELLKIIETHLAPKSDDSSETPELVALRIFEKSMRRSAVEVFGEVAGGWDISHFAARFNEKIGHHIKRQQSDTKMVDEMQETLENERAKHKEAQKELSKQLHNAMDELEEMKKLRLDIRSLEEKLVKSEANLLEAKRGQLHFSPTLQSDDKQTITVDAKLQKTEEQLQYYQHQAIELQAQAKHWEIKQQANDEAILALQGRLQEETRLKEEALVIVHELQAESSPLASLHDDAAVSLFEDMKTMEEEIMGSRGDLSKKRVEELEFLVEDSARAREMWQEKYMKAQRRVEALESVMKNASNGERVVRLEQKLEEAQKTKDDLFRQLMTTATELSAVKGKIRANFKQSEDMDSLLEHKEETYEKLKRKAATKMKNEAERLREKYGRVVDFLKDQVEERDKALRELVEKMQEKRNNLLNRERTMSVAFHSLGSRLQQVLLQYNSLLDERAHQT